MDQNLIETFEVYYVKWYFSFLNSKMKENNELTERFLKELSMGDTWFFFLRAQDCR